MQRVIYHTNLKMFTSMFTKIPDDVLILYLYRFEIDVLIFEVVPLCYHPAL